MLNFEDYKDRLKEICPHNTDEELKNFFDAKVKFWEMMIKDIDKL